VDSLFPPPVVVVAADAGRGAETTCFCTSVVVAMMMGVDIRAESDCRAHLIDKKLISNNDSQTYPMPMTTNIGKEK
jgi:hypothetical protein